MSVDTHFGIVNLCTWHQRSSADWLPKGDCGECMVSERGTPLNGVITTQRWLEVLVAPRKSLADCPHKKWVNGSKWAVAKSEWCSKCGCRFCPFAYTVKNGRAQRDILQITCEEILSKNIATNKNMLPLIIRIFKL